MFLRRPEMNYGSDFDPEAESKSKPVSGKHEESMAILKSLGYNSIGEARAALNDKNKDTHPLLARMIAKASDTAGETVGERKNYNVINVPNEVWTRSKDADEAESEQERAA